MNTVMTRDMIRAIARPASRSRTMETAITRTPLANMPCTNRAISNVVNEVVMIQATPAMAYAMRQMLSSRLRPNRSEIGPKTSCGAPNPAI